jgi:hypothetical protein
MDTCPHIQLGHITPYSCDGKDFMGKMGARNGVGCRLSTSLQVQVSIAIDGINNFIASLFFISFDNAS